MGHQCDSRRLLKKYLLDKGRNQCSHLLMKTNVEWGFTGSLNESHVIKPGWESEQQPVREGQLHTKELVDRSLIRGSKE